MNTINLINTIVLPIALLACILTPAYVLYFLKYQLFANQKKHKATIDTMSKDLSQLHYEVENMILDEAENKLERSKQLLELNQKFDSIMVKHTLTRNHIDNMNVTLDYLRRTFNDDMSKVNERVDLTNATYVQLINNLEQKLVKNYENEWEIQRNFNSVVASKYEKIFKQLDSLESLNEITQQILNRINSKHFAQEVLFAWMKTIKKEKQSDQNDVETPNKPKRGRPSKQQEHNVRNITATELSNEEQVKVQVQEQNEEPIVAFESKEKKKRSPKRNSKRLITMREIETAFKEKTGLTYRGYVLKFGEKEFLRKKANVYDSVYYQKFTKPKYQNLAVKE
jgi:hypothetical protein